LDLHSNWYSLIFFIFLLANLPNYRIRTECILVSSALILASGATFIAAELSKAFVEWPESSLFDYISNRGFAVELMGSGLFLSLIILELASLFYLPRADRNEIA
jgi:hypothetical protein